MYAAFVNGCYKDSLKAVMWHSRLRIFFLCVLDNNNSNNNSCYFVINIQEQLATMLSFAEYKTRHDSVGEYLHRKNCNYYRKKRQEIGMNATKTRLKSYNM